MSENVIDPASLPDDTAEIEDVEELDYPEDYGDPAAAEKAEATGLDPAKQQLGVRGEE